MVSRPENEFMFSFWVMTEEEYFIHGEEYGKINYFHVMELRLLAVHVYYVGVSIYFGGIFVMSLSLS